MASSKPTALGRSLKPGQRPLTDSPEGAARLEPAASGVEDLDVLDWDVRLEPPAPRRAGTVRVTLAYRGRSKPIPIERPGCGDSA